MGKKINICVINGPNLNMLGMREPGVYGKATLADIETRCRKMAICHEIGMEWFQSNSESALIEQIQSCVGKVDWIIINAAGYTHTSVALRDALSLFPGSVIEVLHCDMLIGLPLVRYYIQIRFCPTPTIPIPFQLLLRPRILRCPPPIHHVLHKQIHIIVRIAIALIHIIQPWRLRRRHRALDQLPVKELHWQKFD